MLLEIRDGSACRNGMPVLSHFSFEIRGTEKIAVTGRNGAGKTTAIKCIVGIHGFDQGEIKVDGVSVRANPMYCKSVLAYVPDNPDLYEYLTALLRPVHNCQEVHSSVP